MSGGGERKRREGRGQGWEEAGGEFYQESYPGAEIDLEALTRDPHYFKTLLPSKQNRGATTKRVRTDTKTLKRRTSTRSRYYNTMGHNTVQTADIHVSMMPDLSENLANEETTWEEIMLIKAMPVSMAQKKEMKAKLLSAEAFRLQGLKQLDWRRRKLWEAVKTRWGELKRGLGLWSSGLERIGRCYGSGVASTFALIRTLLVGNIGATIIITIFLIGPTALIIPSAPPSQPCQPAGNTTEEECCPSWKEEPRNESVTIWEVVEGSGRAEEWLLWYGGYRGGAVEEGPARYDLGLAYLGSIGSVLFLTFLWLLREAKRVVSSRLVQSQGMPFSHCRTLFSGWDFRIGSDETGRTLKTALYQEMKEWSDVEKERGKGRTAKILGTRLGLNVVVMAVVATAIALVYFVAGYCTAELHSDVGPPRLHTLLLEYTPYLTVAMLNSVLPWSLDALVAFEGWGRARAEAVRVGRAAIARIALLGTLLASLGPCPPCSSCSLCWETYWGRQVYKLLLSEVFVRLCIAVFVHVPRGLLSRRLRCVPPAQLRPYCVALRTCYLQALSWFGCFFSPLMPALVALAMFLLFYVEKAVCLVSAPPSLVHRPSSARCVHINLLILFFSFSVGPLFYSLSGPEPSASCGPFRGQKSVWAVALRGYEILPAWLRSLLYRASTPAILIPLLVLLVLFLYYYRVIAGANRHMVGVLKKQLVLEGHDKQFLLDRLSAFIKQHQERHKAAARSVRPTTTAST